MENLMGRYRNVSILAAVIFLQILGLAVQVKRQAHKQSTRLIRVWAVGAVTPLERALVTVQDGATGLWHNYFYLRGVRQQNRELEQQIQDLRLEQVRLQQDAEQAHRLQALLGFKEQFIDKTLAAQVIGSSGSEQSRLLYLDKGSADGIAQDMAVISRDGIVGKVVQTFRHTCQVLLINDQNSGVGTILESSRLQGVLKGTATGEIVLDSIMSDEDVKLGERVLTSGGDQIFPKGLPVGTVSKINKGKEFLLVTVRPAAALNHLEEVLVITKKEEREPALASSTPVRAADILAQRLPSVPDQPTQPVPGSAAAAGGSGVAAKPQSATTAPRSPAVAAANSTQSPVAAGKPVSAGSRTAESNTISSAPGQPPLTTQPAATGTSGKALIKTIPGNTQTQHAKPVQPKALSDIGSSTATKSAVNASQQPKSAKPSGASVAKPTAEPAQPQAQPESGDTPQ